MGLLRFLENKYTLHRDKSNTRAQVYQLLLNSGLNIISLMSQIG